MGKKYGYGGQLPAPKVSSTPPRGTEMEKPARKGTKDLHHNGTSTGAKKK